MARRQPRSRPTRMTPALVAEIIALAPHHTQDEIATKVGVSQATVSRCVRENRRDLAEAAGYSVHLSTWRTTEHAGFGYSWFVLDPDGVRFEDDYPSEAEAWAAAAEDARRAK